MNEIFELFTRLSSSPLNWGILKVCETQEGYVVDIFIKQENTCTVWDVRTSHTTVDHMVLLSELRELVERLRDTTT